MGVKWLLNHMYLSDMPGAGASRNTLGSRRVWYSPYGGAQYGFASGQELCNNYSRLLTLIRKYIVSSAMFDSLNSGPLLPFSAWEWDHF